MTSKLERIREAGQDTRFVVGYLSSPAGLNGASVLKEWVEHKMHIQRFDLTREETQFRQRVAEEAAQIGNGLAGVRCET